MATYLEAADFAAFPFRAVTNSSSVLLAQSFGLPVLIPDLSVSARRARGGCAPLRPREHGLVETLERAARLSDQLRSEHGSCREAVRQLPWTGPPRPGLHLEIVREAPQPMIDRPSNASRVVASLRTVPAALRSPQELDRQTLTRGGRSKRESRTVPLARRSATTSGSRIWRIPLHVRRQRATRAGRLQIAHLRSRGLFVRPSTAREYLRTLRSTHAASTRIRMSQPERSGAGP